MLILRAVVKSSRSPLPVRTGVNGLAGRNKPVHFIGFCLQTSYRGSAVHSQTSRIFYKTGYAYTSGEPPPPAPPAPPLSIICLNGIYLFIYLLTRTLSVIKPLTPDNETARFHRHEYVPEVQRPHKPVIFTINEDPATVSSEVGAILGNADAEVYMKKMNPDVPEMPKSEKVEF
ncbi:unnamed protein product [Tuber aestivum]|uniref:Uncharacterized protein n=1 Tax=Tuber aestivum TaxID=59557 RepID=A0A292QAE1_9PEZI|nr:unnamed protein product [Tuber aestivum]